MSLCVIIERKKRVGEGDKQQQQPTLAKSESLRRKYYICIYYTYMHVLLCNMQTIRIEESFSGFSKMKNKKERKNGKEGRKEGRNRMKEDLNLRAQKKKEKRESH